MVQWLRHLPGTRGLPLCLNLCTFAPSHSASTQQSTQHSALNPLPTFSLSPLFHLHLPLFSPHASALSSAGKSGLFIRARSRVRIPQGQLFNTMKKPKKPKLVAPTNPSAPLEARASIHTQVFPDGSMLIHTPAGIIMIDGHTPYDRRPYTRNP